MKTELLTFETTVRVTYDKALAGARKTAIQTARELMSNIGSRSRLTASDSPVFAIAKRSVYRPKAPPPERYVRMAGVDR